MASGQRTSSCRLVHRFGRSHRSLAGTLQRLARCSRLPLHDGVDLCDGILLANGCDVEINHRGRQVSVAQVLLDQLDTDTAFEKMGCVAVPKRMRADPAVVPVKLFKNRFDRSLDGRLAHGFVGGRSLRVVLAFGWENPCLIAMSLVVFSEDEQSGFGQWYQTIFGTLATMDVNHHSIGLDILNLEIESFLQPESQRVDDGEEAQHGGFFDQLEERMNFTDGDDDRDFELASRSYELESGPISRARKGEELLKGLLSDVDSASRPVPIIFNEEEIISQVVFGSGIRISFKEFSELANITDIGFLRPLDSAVKLKILLEANEDGGQRFFVDRHRETPCRNATDRRRFEVNVGRSAGSSRNSD